MINKYSTGFETAFKFMIYHEGGFSDEDFDKGGPTKYGISLRFLKNINHNLNNDGVIDIHDISELTKEDAKKIYYEEFWLYPKINFIPYYRIRIKCFDSSVNMGPKQAIKLLQRSLNCVGKIELEEDGIIGSKTLSSFGPLSEDEILDEYINNLKLFYLALVKKDSSQEKFINGWYNRAKDVPVYYYSKIKQYSSLSDHCLISIKEF